MELENNLYFLLCYGLEGNVEHEESCSYCHGVIDVFLVIVHLGKYNWSQSEKNNFNSQFTFRRKDVPKKRKEIY